MTHPWHSWFAQPWALWLLTLLPPLGLLAAFARWRRRRALVQLGGAFVLQSLLAPRRWSALGRRLCLGLALMLLIVGVAGPQWGRDPDQKVSAGRDLVVVLDLSRSMLAEQPARQKFARDALIGLADSLQKRGGHRVALVVFAARPKLVLPLAQDYDLFRAAVNQQDAARPASDLLPDADSLSGTRIGAALRLALAAHEKDATNPQTILLVSDGDDPADDDEWNAGVVAAVARGIPVCTVGVGDPEKGRTIPVNGQPLRFQEGEVESKLREEVLRQIAERTQGTYVPARRYALPPDGLYQVILDRRELRGVGTGVLPRYRQQYGWFFGAALACLTLATLIRQRQPKGGR